MFFLLCKQLVIKFLQQPGYTRLIYYNKYKRPIYVIIAYLIVNNFSWRCQNFHGDTFFILNPVTIEKDHTKSMPHTLNKFSLSGHP